MTIALATFILGVSLGTLHRHVPEQQSVQPAIPEATPEPPVQDEDYPDDLGTRPYDISRFINEHHSGKLKRLWQRLGVKNDPNAEFSFGDACGYCEAFIYQYNLDADAEREIVLQIRAGLGQMYRYLIFKDSSEGDGTKFLGHIDVWAKYPPNDPVVLMSNGRAWLIVQSTAATGSGLGAWLDTVYDVSNGRVRSVASYLGRVNQSGFGTFPSRTFIGTPVSIEVKHGDAIVTVSYKVDYWGPVECKTPLFTKAKQAVLVGSFMDGATYVDAAHSEITPLEFETVYNFDSMDEDDLLHYNRSELRAIATGLNVEKKAWLKEFLDTRAKGPMKRELLRLLRTAR